MYAFRPDETTPRALPRLSVEPKSASSSPRAVRSGRTTPTSSSTGMLPASSSATLDREESDTARTDKRADDPGTFAEAASQFVEQVPIGLTGFQRFAKRSFDLASIVVILALFWWAMIAVWIAVRLTTGSPVIYGHSRVGRGGREFKCYKFRSMVPNADEVLAHLLASDPAARAEWARDFKLKNDPRITRVGRFIRKTSLDEFPQLWNVLVNDMSIVGPRPVVRAEFDKYYKGGASEHYRSVKPGLTGPWQVGGRNDVGYAERVELDCRYVKSWGLWSDFTIVMRTVGVMRAGKGAY